MIVGFEGASGHEISYVKFYVHVVEELIEAQHQIEFIADITISSEIHEVWNPAKWSPRGSGDSCGTQGPETPILPDEPPFRP